MGVIHISVRYQLFLCGQIHHSLTDARCSVSCCVRLLQRSNKEVCQPNTSSINVSDDAVRMNLLLSSHSTTQPSAEPPTRSQPSYPYTSSHTHTLRRRQITALLLSSPHTHSCPHVLVHANTQPNLSTTRHPICQPAAPVSRCTKRLKACCQKEKQRRRRETHKRNREREDRRKCRKI